MSREGTLHSTTAIRMRYEYQIVQLQFAKGTDPKVEMVEVLNRFGAEGWRLVPFQVDPIRAVNEKHYRLLLERENPAS